MPPSAAVTDETVPAPLRRGAFYSLRVSEVERLCDDAVVVSFDVPTELAEVFRFRAGQTLTLRRVVDGVEQRRSYSICATEGDRPRIGVRQVHGGLFSSWLVEQVGPGDVVDVAAPSGGFTPDLTRDEHHVLIAAGSGITPVLSIAGSVLRSTQGTVTLLYGNRRSDTVMFADDLADLKDRYPDRLELVHVLSREPREAELFTGRLDADKLNLLLTTVVDQSAVGQWWLCGPYRMVCDAQDVLHDRGVVPERIHQELFFVDEAPPEPAHRPEPGVEGPSSEVTAVLDGRATTLTVAHDTPILDGAQRSRPDMPFACKGGVCGTCRAQVTEGQVDMRRNFALEQSEVDAGFVLTCQSLPVSDTIRVDYDT